MAWGQLGSTGSAVDTVQRRARHVAAIRARRRAASSPPSASSEPPPYTSAEWAKFQNEHNGRNALTHADGAQIAEFDSTITWDLAEAPYLVSVDVHDGYDLVNIDNLAITMDRNASDGYREWVRATVSSTVGLAAVPYAMGVSAEGHVVGKIAVDATK